MNLTINPTMNRAMNHPMSRPTNRPVNQRANPSANLRDIRIHAMNLLARREQLRGELAVKLCRRFGNEPEVEVAVAAVLGRLDAEGLQSDERYIESYIRQRAGRGYGPERIRMELKQKGAASAAVDAAMEICGQNWLEVARAARLKKFGGNEPADLADRARQVRFLNYRGFSGDLTIRLFARDED